MRLPDESVMRLADWFEGSQTSPSRHCVREDSPSGAGRPGRAEPTGPRILVLRHLEQLSVQEIAEVLGIRRPRRSPATAGLERLHERLDGQSLENG